MSMAVVISTVDRGKRGSNLCLDAPLSDEIMSNQMLTEWEIDPMCGSGQMAIGVLSNLPTSYVFASDVAPQSEFAYGQLSGLQEYSQKLKQAVRTITQELESLDTRLWKYPTYQNIAQTNSPEEWAAWTTQPNLLAPSLNLPFTQGALYFGSIQEDVWAYVVSIDRKVSEFLHCRQRRLQWALCQVNEAVAVILNKIACSVTGFFCGMRWERRRWFLRHGARPPKKRLQAISSLFPEACLGL
jgi:hypothetical protein